MKLSILIPTTEDRKEMTTKLVDLLLDQIELHNASDDVEVITLYDKMEKESIGFKRNKLLDMSKGEYLCFFDSDDVPGKNYIKHLLDGIKLGVDCISLRGVITFDGNNPAIFEHSIKYDAYKTTTNAVMYERYPNHLNCIKSSISKQFIFPSINHGEDTDWATQIFRSGLIKTEHYVDEVIYHYQFVTNK